MEEKYRIMWEHAGRAALYVRVDSHDALRVKIDTILKYPHAPLEMLTIVRLTGESIRSSDEE